MRKHFAWIAGLACAATLMAPTPASAAVRNLYLAATDGFSYLPDHNGYPPDVNGPPPSVDPGAPYRKVYMRGFCDDTPAQIATSGCAMFPAPIIDVNVGDDVFITLRNIDNANPVAPKDPHTIHLHGQQVTTQNDGFNETAFEVPEGTQAVYYWYADKAGTFMWHCHVEASEHITMGMYGALIVRPDPRKIGTVYGGKYNDAYDKEYVWLLSDVDSIGRDAIQSDFNPALLGVAPGSPRGAAITNYNFARFDADYWVINGRAFPDTIFGTSTPADDAACAADPARHADLALDFEGCNHRASGPPSGFLTGSNNLASYAPLVVGNWGDRVLVRMINMGYQDQSFHFHGWHFNVVGKDANPLPILSQVRQYTLHIGSGETYDVIINMVKTANHENSGAGPNGVGHSVITGQGGDLNEFACVWGIYSAPGDCSGALGDDNVDVQWYPAHSHYDYQVTNNGLYPGGLAGILLAVP